MNIVLYWMKWKYPKMKPKKIEVGDKVRVLKSSYPDHIKVGKIYKVLSVENDGRGIMLPWRLNNAGGYFNVKEVELVDSSKPAVKKSEEETGWGF